MWFKENKKAITLIVLVLGLIFYWATAYFKGSNIGKEVVKAPAKKTAAAPAMDTAIRVDVDLLKRAVEPYKIAKNIFAPVYIKPVLVKPATKSKKPGNGAITVTPLPPLPPPPPPKSQQEIEADNAREEMQKVKVLGFLKRKQRTDVFLSLGNNNYIVGKGDVITKDYYLVDVTKDSVIVSDRKTGIQVKVPADFSGKNAKSMVLPGVGQAGSSPPAYQQPNPGIGGAMPGSGRFPGQRAPAASGGGIYGSGGTLPTPMSLGNQPPPSGGYSIK